MANYMNPPTTQEQIESKLVKRGRDMLVSGTNGESVYVAIDNLQGAAR
jgi:hypothetical protein